MFTVHITLVPPLFILLCFCAYSAQGLLEILQQSNESLCALPLIRAYASNVHAQYEAQQILTESTRIVLLREGLSHAVEAIVHRAAVLSDIVGSGCIILGFWISGEISQNTTIMSILIVSFFSYSSGQILNGITDVAFGLRAMERMYDFIYFFLHFGLR
jgi:hypothetical protein